MSADTTATPLPWSTPSAAEIADAAGADDLFVFRRIADGRFAHVGGIGRGAGWAGIVEVGVDDEPLVEQALASGGVVRRSSPEPWHVLGPYYAHSVVTVSVTPDVFVVFGSERDDMADVPDDDFAGLARFAAEALVEVTPAKQLADEIEALNAVRDLLHAPAETFEEALQRLVGQATTSLSCDLGLLYLPEQRQLAVCDNREEAPMDTEAATATLAALSERGSFPVCIQRAEEDDLPAPFSSAMASSRTTCSRSAAPSRASLLLHTKEGVARGFTLLCQSLGVRLVEAAEPLLAGALLRDTLNADLERAEREARRDSLTGSPTASLDRGGRVARGERGCTGQHRSSRLSRPRVRERRVRPWVGDRVSAASPRALGGGRTSDLRRGLRRRRVRTPLAQRGRVGDADDRRARMRARRGRPPARPARGQACHRRRDRA